MNRPPRDWSALLTPSEGAPPPSISDQELLAGLWTLEHQLNACIIRMDRFQHPEIKRHQRELRAVAVKVTGIRLASAQVLRIDPRRAGQEDLSPERQSSGLNINHPPMYGEGRENG